MMKDIKKYIFLLLSSTILINTSFGQKDSSKATLTESLKVELDSVLVSDQRVRKEYEDIKNKYGVNSKEVKALLKEWKKIDSINCVKVTAIIDKYGWLGKDEVGRKGNSALFLVIQHSDLRIQEKYLPIMRKAVKEGKAEAPSLALLEDRVLVLQGKRQMYGSQIGVDTTTNPVSYYIKPLQDPDNVDKRRAEMGMRQTLAEYVSKWGIIWNVEQYKKDLPSIESKEKQIKNKNQ